LYNYALHDLKGIGGHNEKATVIIDMGAENTTLVVCSQTGIWQRSIRIGGNAFSEAIADAFHLSFRKAEKLKRTAPMSKYMRQIFTAMKPVFTDLGSEIQRSLGFYSSSGPGREKGFARVIALGGGMKLQGLAKYLQQTLRVPVVKLDSFRSLTLNSSVSSAKFHENVSDFGIVYGLGVQLLGEPRIEVNLLPRKMARAMAWRRKGRMFMIAASILFGVSLLGLVRANIDKGKYRSNADLRRTIASVISTGQKTAGALKAQEARAEPSRQMFKKEMDKFDYRDVIPAVNHMVMSCLPNKDNTPDHKALYEAFGAGDVAGVVSWPRGDRKQLFVTGISVAYSSELEKATFDKNRRKAYRRPSVRDEGRYGRDEMDYEGRGDMSMEGGRGRYPGPGAVTGQPGVAAVDETKRGFVVMIEGYSPYKDISALLDPHSVGTDKERWGLVTRLVHISEIVKGCPFELYKKNDIKHFVLQSGPVDLRSSETPVGIGVEKEMERVPMQLDTTVGPGRAGMMGRYNRPNRNMNMSQREYIYFETVLIDPMTSEEMSKVYDIVTQDEIDNDPGLSEKDLGRIKLDDFGVPLFIERDYWFRINAKFVWKNAPALPERPLMYDDPYGMGMGRMGER
ncbi:MAG: pilus assembly protein PilM, partial [Planctomycetes bacterium]|nr:pilus assembly protein PilM [Planctomycetota bacterium]